MRILSPFPAYPSATLGATAVYSVSAFDDLEPRGPGRPASAALISAWLRHRLGPILDDVPRIPESFGKGWPSIFDKAGKGPGMMDMPPRPSGAPSVRAAAPPFDQSPQLFRRRSVEASKHDEAAIELLVRDALEHAQWWLFR